MYVESEYQFTKSYPVLAPGDFNVTAFPYLYVVGLAELSTSSTPSYIIGYSFAVPFDALAVNVIESPVVSFGIVIVAFCVA